MKEAWKAELSPRLLFWALSILLLASFCLAFWHTAWVTEDAYITFRVVDNALQGFGWVWNVGERVQAYTHPLWFFLLMAIAKIANIIGLSSINNESFLPLLSIVASFACALAGWLVAFRMARPASVLSWLCLFALLFSRAFIDYSSSGLENPLTHCLLAIFLLAFVKKENLRQLFVLALLFSLLFLNRPDSITLVVPACLWVFWRVPENFRKKCLVALAGLLPVLLWEGFSVFYYGSPVPNTALAKVFTGIPASDYMQQAALYVVYSLFYDWPTIAIWLGGFAALALCGKAKGKLLAAGLALHGFYLFDVGGDYMGGRFFSEPVWLAALGMAWAFRDWRPQTALFNKAQTQVAGKEAVMLLAVLSSALLFLARPGTAWLAALTAAALIWFLGGRIARLTGIVLCLLFLPLAAAWQALAIYWAQLTASWPPVWPMLAICLIGLALFWQSHNLKMRAASTVLVVAWASCFASAAKASAWLLSAVALAALLWDMVAWRRTKAVAHLRNPSFLVVGTMLVLFALAMPRLDFTLFSPSNFKERALRLNGVSDERGAYFEKNSLLSLLLWPGRQYVYGKQADLRLFWQDFGRQMRESGKGGIYVARYVGMMPQAAGTKFYFIDLLALADPFLARLPAVPDSRVGHYERLVPEGYLLSRLTHRNHLANPALAALYDDVVLATQGGLFDPARLGAIWRLNSGYYHGAGEKATDQGRVAAWERFNDFGHIRSSSVQAQAGLMFDLPNRQCLYSRAGEEALPMAFYPLWRLENNPPHLVQASCFLAFP